MLSPHHRWQPSYIKVQLLEVKISLVSDEYHCYFVVRVAFCFVQPFPDIVEAFSIGDIIDEDHPDGASVVWPRDRFKGLLTSLCYIDHTVSQICSLICLLLAVITLDPNSTPMVVSWSNLNFFSRNWSRMQDFPTPEYSPSYLYPRLRSAWTDRSKNSF